MQSYGNSFSEDVVLDDFNMINSDDHNFKKRIFRNLYYKEFEF